MRSRGSTPPSPQPIRILLADRLSLFREAIRSGLEGQRDLRVVGEARSGPEAIAEAERASPDVAIVAVDLLAGGGSSLTARIHERSPTCRVLALGGDEDYGRLIELLDGGVAGYLTKEAPLSELMDATRA